MRGRVGVGLIMTDKFITYFEGYLQKLDREGKISHREIVLAEAYFQLFAKNPKTSPLLDGFIDFVKNTPEIK